MDHMMDDSNASCEPMDIDLSSSSTSKMDISLNEQWDGQVTMVGDITCDIPKVSKCEPIENQIKQCIKIYHINMNCSQKKIYFSKPIIICFTLLVLCISLVMYHIVNFECCDELDGKRIQKVLSENLFGQYEASNAIVKALEIKSSNKIMFLYGGTGVGKTFAASLILDKLWKYSNIYYFVMPSFADTFSSELLLGLTFCKTSVLVVDDLKRNDIPSIKSHIISVIDKSESLGRKTTIVLMFNCDNITENFVKRCEETFITDLEQGFADIKAVKQFVKFVPLTEEHLKKCIEKELGGRKLMPTQMDNILKNFNVSSDGCKGVYTKIKFLNIE